jgi:hypothetical protein
MNRPWRKTRRVRVRRWCQTRAALSYFCSILQWAPPAAGRAASPDETSAAALGPIESDDQSDEECTLPSGSDEECTGIEEVALASGEEPGIKQLSLKGQPKASQPGAARLHLTTRSAI